MPTIATKKISKKYFLEAHKLRIQRNDKDHTASNVKKGKEGNQTKPNTTNSGKTVGCLDGGGLKKPLAKSHL